MTRFVGYKKNGTDHDELIYESMTDVNWAHTKKSHITADNASTVAFMLIDFDLQTATITANSLATTIAIDFFPTLALYMHEVIVQMDTELAALISEHGVTSTR